jgi:hypothetical protein
MTAAFLATPASAIETTADLRDACAAEDEATRNFCFGYIKGAGHLYVELVRANAIPQIACADPVPTLEVIRVSVVEWIDANPQHADDRAIDGLLQASAETWPCD